MGRQRAVQGWPERSAYTFLWSPQLQTQFLHLNFQLAIFMLLSRRRRLCRLVKMHWIRPTAPLSSLAFKQFSSHHILPPHPPTALDDHFSPLWCHYGSLISLVFYRSYLFFFFFKKRTFCHIVWPSLIIERLSCSCHAKAMTLKNLSAAIYIKMTCLEGNKQINIHNARVEHIHRKHVS